MSLYIELRNHRCFYAGSDKFAVCQGIKVPPTWSPRYVVDFVFCSGSSQYLGCEKRSPDNAWSPFFQGCYHSVRTTLLDGIHAPILMHLSSFSGIVRVPSSLSLQALCFTHGFNPSACRRKNMKLFNRFSISNKGQKIMSVSS